ncbi:MAG TPA: hypothetical protein VGB82_00730 [Alphaproteobacteria bacterium]
MTLKPTGSAALLASLLGASLLLAAPSLAKDGDNGDSSQAEDRGNDDSGQTAASCKLHARGSEIRQVVYLQFDNVHFRRDNPNVPSDLEQMPNLLNFLKDQGTVLTNHHTPLISHTAVDILTALSGLYGDRMGVPVGNSFRYFNPDGTTNGAASFAYWTDPLAAFSGPAITDTTPQMIGKDGKIAPAPWAAFARAGCDVGAFSVANIEFENVGLDIATVFGPNSPEAAEAKSDPAKAQADFLGIAVHCAQNSPLCTAGKPDVLTDEPGGYVGFNALFGNKNVQPAISPSGPVKDLDGNVIQDSHGNPGFPNLFNPSATQSLGYVATMLESGIPVVYGYISDAHDNHATGSGTFGPGQLGYEQQLQQYDAAFGKFFARLKADNITARNTLFVVTSDENDHFVGGAPTPANCDGVTVPCTYAQIGEINADLSRLVATQKGNTTKFTVHSDSAPTVYITGNPGQTAPVTRQLERDMASLTTLNPITGATDNLMAAMAGVTQMKLLHMVTADPARTPTFTYFGNENYFIFSSGQTKSCTQTPACVVEQPGFAWNHGDFQKDITRTFLGLVGPGVRQLGAFDGIFSDHADVRPTIMGLVGIEDDYDHDGRVLFEVFDDEAGSLQSRAHRGTLLQLAQAYKDINAPLGTLGKKTLMISTTALSGDDATYAFLDAKLAGITTQRDALAAQMIGIIEDATFDRRPIDKQKAESLIDQAKALLASVQ